MRPFMDFSLNAEQEIQSTNLLYIMTLPGAGPHAHQLAQDLKKHFRDGEGNSVADSALVVSLRDKLLGNGNGTGEKGFCSKTFSVRGTELQQLEKDLETNLHPKARGEKGIPVIVVNDLGLPILPPADAYTILDLREPNLFAKSRYHRTTWGKLLADCCHAALFSPDSVSEKERHTQDQIQLIIEFLCGVNPDISIARPYTVSPLAFKNFLKIERKSAIQKRVLVRPGCLDHVTVSTSGGAGADVVPAYQTVHGQLHCVHVPYSVVCYDANSLISSVEEITANFHTPFTVLAVELDVKVLDVSQFPQKRDVFRLRRKFVGGSTTHPRRTGENQNPWAPGFTAFILTSGDESDSPTLPEVETHLKNVLAGCELTLPTAAVPEPVTEAELKAISRSVPLPDGWWYDGEFYLQFPGGVRQFPHPLADEILREEERKRKEEVGKRNAEYTDFLKRVLEVEAAEEN